MSDSIKHECGIALIRLLKPLDYYRSKYGSKFWGINRLHIMLEKQRNRGQDGAGIATVKLDTAPGERYISRFRSFSSDAINQIFGQVFDPNHGESEIALSSELLMGHLRYGTFGKNNIDSCHPFLRQNNWKTKNLVISGNFNLTNVDELFDHLVDLGQHPKEKADTVTILERIGHFLDEENDRLHRIYKDQGFTKKEISSLIAQNLDITNILKESSKRWDGGYVITGMIGHGDAFVLRDPNSIRPCYYFKNDEVVVVASERPAIQTAFNVSVDQIQELPGGSAIIIKKSGDLSIQSVNPPLDKKSCSFERIYFSRGNDRDVFQERKALGYQLTSQVLRAIDFDTKNTVFSFIPNTAEVAYYGLVDGVENHLQEIKTKISKFESKLESEFLDAVMSMSVRMEKVIIKDAKLRTFISNDEDRDDLVSHVYDVTYGSIKEGVDNLVVIDDSIVRGTTLKQSIITMLNRLNPKKIVVVSSCPQIRYPDCYGIDMSRIGQLIAFQAAIQLLKENSMGHIIHEVYEKCKEEILKPKEHVRNLVKLIYDPFTDDQISKKISEMVTSENITCEVEVVYQTLDGLRAAIPGHTGDWYFSGEYPTPGGNVVVNKSFINFYEGNGLRAY